MTVLHEMCRSAREPACHGNRRRSPNNEVLFREPGLFDVVVG